MDARALTVLASLRTGTHPNTVAVDRSTGLAYVSNKARSALRPAPGQLRWPRTRTATRCA
ncbi:hypothetical protein [Roseomonas populi]|uniref:Uncharacterized protein n=1 Tax=Roseomonas populi TaxID=3121582 RepID=A0ABT1X7K7_9PROT|nr:hypothetical protein [Roseomonas pecuniae]MCR0984097.1 hypothetical protein [Roseomonas pecuniae]